MPSIIVTVRLQTHTTTIHGLPHTKMMSTENAGSESEGPLLYVVLVR